MTKGKSKKKAKLLSRSNAPKATSKRELENGFTYSHTLSTTSLQSPNPNLNSPVHAAHNNSLHTHTSQTPSNHVHTSFFLLLITQVHFFPIHNICVHNFFIHKHLTYKCIHKCVIHSSYVCGYYYFRFLIYTFHNSFVEITSAVCFHSLSAYANAIQTSPKRLAETALAVTLSRAQSTKLFVSRLTRFKGLKKREVEAIKDCVEEINDTIDRLTKSVQEMKLCGSAKNQEQFAFHMSNAQTWTSAALTDENTCSDGFSGRVTDGRIKNSVRARIVNVGHETSNALSLINAFAKKY